MSQTVSTKRKWRESFRQTVTELGSGGRHTCHGTGNRIVPLASSYIELKWHLVALDAAINEGLPFFIQWHVDDSDHPGRGPVEHRSAVVGIDWIELGGGQDRLEAWDSMSFLCATSKVHRGAPRSAVQSMLPAVTTHWQGWPVTFAMSSKSLS
jgi:hypothetical protein